MKSYSLKLQESNPASSLAGRIAHTIATTPEGPQRVKALKAIRWVLACSDGPEGYARLTGTFECTLTQNLDRASVFDGRDNEELKSKFWTAQLGRKMVPALL